MTKQSKLSVWILKPELAQTESGFLPSLLLYLLSSTIVSCLCTSSVGKSDKR